MQISVQNVVNIHKLNSSQHIAYVGKTLKSVRRHRRNKNY